MPVYNTPENYLREAIDSILNQTFQDFELLIIDDCSTKIDVKSIIEKYDNKKIKYLKNPKNLGAAEARNLGLKNAEGEFIAILDSDDIALPLRFEKQVNYLKVHPEVGAVGSWAEVFPEKQIWMPPEHFSFFNVLTFAPWLINSSMMMRKNILDKYELKYDTSYVPSEDYHLWSHLIRYTKIANIQEVLVRYRAGEGISFTQYDKMIIQSNRIKQEMLDFLTLNDEIQEQIKSLLMVNITKSKTRKHRNKYKIKYCIYKGLWILGGKGNFYKTKMEKTKRKMKGL